MNVSRRIAANQASHLFFLRGVPAIETSYDPDETGIGVSVYGKEILDIYVSKDAFLEVFYAGSSWCTASEMHLWYARGDLL